MTRNTRPSTNSGTTLDQRPFSYGGFQTAKAADPSPSPQNGPNCGIANGCPLSADDRLLQSTGTGNYRPGKWVGTTRPPVPKDPNGGQIPTLTRRCQRRPMPGGSPQSGNEKTPSTRRLAHKRSSLSGQLRFLVQAQAVQEMFSQLATRWLTTLSWPAQSSSSWSVGDKVPGKKTPARTSIQGPLEIRAILARDGCGVLSLRH